MHVLLHTWLVAAQNVIFHPVGQLAPPTLGGFLLVHRNWCTHPKVPRARVHTMEQGRHVHTNRGAEFRTQERQGIQAGVRVLPQGQVDRAVRPYCLLVAVLLLVEEGPSHQVLDESLLPHVKLGCVGYPHQPPPVPLSPVPLSIVLNQDVRERPFGEVRQDDPPEGGVSQCSPVHPSERPTPHPSDCWP